MVFWSWEERTKQRQDGGDLSAASCCFSCREFAASVLQDSGPFGCEREYCMNVFHCDHCRNLVFFENVSCVRCGHRLAYLPDLGVIGSLDPAGSVDTFRSPLPRARGHAYRLCRNYTEHGVCNWVVSADEPGGLCRSCRLTRTIPDLTRPGYREAWSRLEAAKRRLVYTLLALDLPLPDFAGAPDGALAFEFLADPDDPNEPRVLTGHAAGVITVNIAEADDAERERRRVALGEPYRTLLGHLRHESGHYYFDQLVVPHAARLDAFRTLFGDERQDYAEALKQHYQQGPDPTWTTCFVSAYAASHPWEDWAESWAHYLHIVDTLETAAACGLSLTPRRRDEPALEVAPDPVADRATPFDTLIESWHPVAYALNELNRGLGRPDAYPFVLPAPAVEKLRFVHDTVSAAGR
jgi:hypothetical protein